MRIVALLASLLVAAATAAGCAGSTEDGTAEGRDPDGGGGSSAGSGADGGPWPDGMAAAGGALGGGPGSGGAGGGAASPGSGGSGAGASGGGGGCSPIDCTNYATCQQESQCVTACPAAPNESCNLKDDDCDASCDEGAGCRVGVHRSYSASSDSHFYTTNPSEAGCCGFVLEFSNFFQLYASQVPGLVAFHRCLLSNGTHFYTTSANCEGAAATYEGVLGYIAESPVCGSTPLHRLYKPTSGDHFYTTSDAEKDSAVASSGYVYEFVAGHVWTAP